MAKFGDIIRVLRIKRGYSQAKLSQLIGIKRSALSNYELGIREPDLDTIELFADFFDVSVDDLMGREEEELQRARVAQAPITEEARMISAGIDKLPPEARKRAVGLYELMFAQYYDEKGEIKRDARS